MYVDDHVNSYVLSMQSLLANGKVYNVGITKSVDNRELAFMVAGKLGFDCKNIALDSCQPRYPYRPLVSGQSSIVLASEKRRLELRWQPIVSLSEGLDRVIDYFKTKNRKNADYPFFVQFSGLV
jgi:nucleoside-diphosphate-sugar epimerase